MRQDGSGIPHTVMGNAASAPTFQPGDKVPAPIKDPPYVPPAVLPKTDNQRIKELKQMLIEGKGQEVVQKVIQIALEDGHPGQMAALKLCMERALPVSMFEKTAAQRSAINITISGLTSPPELKDIVDG